MHAGLSDKGKGKGKGDLMAMLAQMMGGGYGKGKGKGKDESRKTMERLKKVEPECKMWIGGLPKGLTWKELETHIAEAATKPSITTSCPMAKASARSRPQRKPQLPSLP